MERPLAGGSDGVGQGGLAAHHHDGCARERVPEPGEALEPRGSREDQVQQHRLGAMLREKAKALLGASRLDDREPILLEERPDHPPEVRLVVDDQNLHDGDRPEGEPSFHRPLSGGAFSPAPGASNGSRTTNPEPPPSLLNAQTTPPCA